MVPDRAARIARERLRDGPERRDPADLLLPERGDVVAGIVGEQLVEAVERAPVDEVAVQREQLVDGEDVGRLQFDNMLSL